MKKHLLIAAALGIVSVSALAAGPQITSPPIVPGDPVAAGRELVAQLLSLRPAENLTNTAVLRVQPRNGTAWEVPVRVEVRSEDSQWSTIYRTSGTNTEHAATVAVIRRDGQSNEYQMVGESCVSGGTNIVRKLSGSQAFIPFVGSDFFLADFGMEFLQWPTQRVLKKELCRGQACNKLESIAAPGQGLDYVRVLAWFDIDTGGPVLVEAYDAKGKLVKEFRPTVFKKVDGQWQVEEIEMADFRSRSRTTIRFDLGGQ